MKTGEMMALPETAEPQALEQTLLALETLAAPETRSPAIMEARSLAAMEVQNLAMVLENRRARAVPLEMEAAEKIQAAARAGRLPERI